MKTFALAATIAAASILGTAAQAAVYISLDGTTPAYSLPGNGSFSFDPDCTVLNCGGFETVTIDGSAPPTFPGLLHTDIVAVNEADTGDAELTIWVTRTDLTNLSDEFFSSFSTNNQGGAVNTELTTLISPTNALFGGVELASFTNNTVGAAAHNENSVFNTSPGGTYSVTERYVIRASAFQSELSASPSVTVAGVPGAVVPEPGTWALMIMGFGGAGAMIRSRRVRVATA